MKYALATLAATLLIVGYATEGPAGTERSGNVANHDPRVVPESLDPQIFLEKNRLKPGVIETASGLQYEIVRQGIGATPTLGDRIELIYGGHVLGIESTFDGNRKSGVADLSVPIGSERPFGGTKASCSDSGNPQS